MLSRAADWMFVTGALSGEPISVGDEVSIRDSDQETVTTVESVELHSRPGKTTIMLGADLRSIVAAGTLVQRWD